MLSLTHEFRHSEALEDRDKLYALRGLVKTDRQQLQLTVDYKKGIDDISTEFAKECIKTYRHLLVLASIDERDRAWWDLPPSSWSPYWGRPWIIGKSKDPRQPLWIGGDSSDEKSGSAYSASGGAPSRYRVGFVDPEVIAVQEFIYDFVNAVGDTFLTSKSLSEQVKVVN